MNFRIKIEPEGHDDIQEGIDWYNKQSAGLGKKFHQAVKTSFIILKNNPFYQVRYGKMRCLPLKKFPYMIHFTINEEKGTVTVHAIFHTSINPKNWKDNKDI